LLVADALKSRAFSAHGLGVPEEEIAALFERVMKEGDAFFLGLGLKVNKKVPADDEVELGEWWVGQEVLPGEDHALPDILVNDEKVIVIY
jgi:hypothetical protein